jgi:alpha-ketoglutarate-dependent taurine dioxygenase
MSIATNPLTDYVGVEVLGLTAADLQRDDVAAELDHLLCKHGVLVFREIHVDDAAQVGFSRQLGEVQLLTTAAPCTGRSPTPSTRPA